MCVLGLMEAKVLVESAPLPFVVMFALVAAEGAMAKLDEAGA
ncbi:ribosomal protein L7/L12 [Nocardia abscessus]|nr:ribosomal protein L7/L12 [Nocardia abscessus]